MRLWSIHLQYLDTKGLLAVWRESLLAKKVLQGRTKGYKAHPQLLRFRNHPSPLGAINFYLKEIHKASQKRGFNFDASKIDPIPCKIKIPVTNGQIKYEFEHLMKKLKVRDAIRYKALKGKKRIATHPLFEGIPGEIETWEKI